MLDLKLLGKNAIVTGGSSGIGKACAKALFKEGVNVAIVGKKHAKEVVSEIECFNEGKNKNNKVIGINADLSKLDEIRTIVKTAIGEFKSIDILVNCAGAAHGGAFFELEDCEFIDPLILKLVGYIRMIRELSPHMISRNVGSIVNIVGASGRTPSSTLIPVSITNAALISFTRGISKELALHNIRINAISPGTTETERAKILAKQVAEAKMIDVNEVIGDNLKSIPLGRMTKPEEIASMVLYLVSDFSKSITGTEILIDGGKTPGI